jgi:hypothetical protein
MKIKTKRLLWVLTVLAALTALASVLWTRRFHRYTPIEALQDIQAAARVRHSTKPVEGYLEARYGSMAEPANRQKAFLDFFNIGHIEGLNILVGRMPGDRRQASIKAMGEWVANYRRTMSAEEKESLGRFLQSEPGRATLKRAASEYLQKDVHFRAATAPVIEELMSTVSAVQKP